MKKKLLTLILALTLITTYGQRYLYPVFSTVNITSNIVYGNALNYQSVNKVLKLDFYEPAGDTVSKRPLIIYMHGGALPTPIKPKHFPTLYCFATVLP